MGESEYKVNVGKVLPSESPVRHRWPRTVLGYTLAVLCLCLVLRHLNPGEFLHRLAALNFLWVAAAILFDVLSYICQGWRWKLLLRPVAEITVLRTTQAIYAGLFVNQVLPMKLGEIARAFLISRWTSAKLSSIFPSILLERLCDGVWLAVGIIITILLVPLPRRLVEVGDVFDVFVFVTVVIVALLAVGARRPVSNNSTQKESLGTLVRILAFEIRVATQTRGALLALMLSLLLMLLQGLSFWFVMRAYGLPLTFAMGMVVFIIVHFGTLIPTAPANVGSYQFFTVLGLTVFGVEKATAAGFSLVVFTVLAAPLWAIGLWAVGSSGLSFREIKSELARLLAPAKLRQMYQQERP